MSWTHVDRTTTTAERKLTRATSTSKVVKSAWSFTGTRTIPAEEASVGGTTTKTHDTWKCNACRAYATTAASEDGGKVLPDKCGRCGSK